MDWAILLAAGLAAGIVSGLFGVGGGIVMTPILHYLLGHTWADAVALSLFVIAVQAPIGLWRHHKKAAVHWAMAAPLIAGGIVGVALGHWLLPRIDVPWLKVGFAVLMAFAAYRMIAKVQPRDGDGPGAGILVALGFGAGVVSRLLGVGGGILTVPVLVLAGVPAHIAVGTSLVPVWTNALVASLVNLADGLAWTAGIPLALGAVVGAPAGVWAAHALPEQQLRRVVAVGLALVAVYVAVTSGIA